MNDTAIIIVLNFLGIVGAHLVSRVKLEHRITVLETLLKELKEDIQRIPCADPHSRVSTHCDVTRK